MQLHRWKCAYKFALVDFQKNGRLLTHCHADVYRISWRRFLRFAQKEKKSKEALQFLLVLPKRFHNITLYNLALTVRTRFIA